MVKSKIYLCLLFREQRYTKAKLLSSSYRLILLFCKCKSINLKEELFKSLLKYYSTKIKENRIKIKEEGEAVVEAEKEIETDIK